MSVQAIERALLTGKWEGIPQDTSFADAADIAKQSSREISQEGDGLEDKPIDEWFSFTISAQNVSAEQEIIRLAVAVACLHSFVQANWTGPDLDFQVSDPTEVGSLLHRKAVTELAHGGEPAYHLADVPLFLRVAKLLLELPYDHCPSVVWWRLRAWLVHQQVLDEPTAVPADLLSSVEPLLQSFASHPDLAGRLILEQGLLEHHLGHDKSAADYFIRAARATQLEYELTGALGKRTKFNKPTDDDTTDTEQSKTTAAQTTGTTEQAGAVASLTTRIPETLALNDDTLLEQTEFTSSSASEPGSRLAHLNPSSQPALHPLDQSILLALCLNVRNTSPSHGLTAEQMKPYVNRVISHPKNWSRSTLQLQALVDQMPTADSTVSERLLYFHSIPLPSKWEMEKELALRYLSLGVVKSALEIFERLEMWEEVVKCWQSMERRERGIAIVRDLLEGRKAEADTVIAREKVSAQGRRQTLDAMREAKLWCLLGDLEPENALDHYNKAWGISKDTSGRAMRSLGGYYFARADYPNSITCLRKAVAINPLLGRSWFILGCSYSFTRCVTLDDEDGESWNNLASIYLRMGEAGKRIEMEDSEEVKTGDLVYSDETSKSIPFSNKMLAFRALKQGLKFAYDNWRMWSNYMIVAMDVGELSEACRALGRIDGAESVDADVLDRLVDAVTRAPANPDDAVEGSGSGGQAVLNPNEGHGLLRRVNDLFERTILPRVSSPRIFRARARLLTWQGETDVQKWREAVGEVEEMVDVLRNFGPRAEGFKWKLQARSILRTFMGRTKDFEDEPQWSRLIESLEEIRKEE
ncbi:uncharacterized protein B0H18DRAFT_1094527 [Fomitopsis serialis]|uniref:uncharacterized protein n=1 Tax=Fomitopsis serialis TaxID=139415 RepID=UPI002007E94F|nr:uncharacterized protein B0H18DRAFT_1094527 [Neoantrodia serialis]KAH9927341.1 hypothetical protein B0H18DRAFT_1094527 [Neoantrodia serialis]